MNQKHLTTCGFTLIEMSIVLVIIGLIIGGILTGKSLIHNSKMRSVVSEIATFQAAANSFVDKFGWIPGDITNAQSYWPDTCLDQCCGNRCNGNGDGLIVGNGTEDLRYWQHLSLAGLLKGNYNGNLYSNPRYRLKQNTPPSAITGGGYWMRSNSGSCAGRDANYAILGKASTINASGVFTGAILTPVDAHQIDKKIDDGLAHRGKVCGNSSNTGLGNGNCNVGNDGTDYNLTNDAVACRMMFGLFAMP